MPSRCTTLSRVGLPSFSIQRPLRHTVQLLRPYAAMALRLAAAVFLVFSSLPLSLLLPALPLTAPQTAEAAATWYVAPFGLSANACTSLATACSTVAGAIGKAAAGDTIEIAAGVYKERITVGKALTIKGAGADRTVLDGQQGGIVVTVSSGVTASLSGLTIRNGKTTGNGGGVANNGGNLTL
ncbi:MAG: hypothetical protein NTZ05_17545, partial [Chloroflexi bacterium]|nr:hypothetical protein [Chloroflexota bacterium]